MASFTFVSSAVFVIFSALSYYISFVTPYWLESEERAGSPFEKIGLWTACLKNYVDPSDYVSKLYDGCWWIFWPEYILIRGYLNPPWFVALQVLSVANLFAVSIGLISITGMGCGMFSKDSLKAQTYGFTSLFFSAGLSALELFLFGLGSIDRTWMPLVDFNKLSWSYWLLLVSGVCAFFAAVAMITYWYAQRYEYEEEDAEYKRDTRGSSSSGGYNSASGGYNSSSGGYNSAAGGYNSKGGYSEKSGQI